MLKYNLAAIVWIAGCICGTAALAQENRGTPEQQAACTPDAFKFCSSYFPDPTKVESCLRQRKPDLSNACRSVFESGTETASTRSK